MWRFWGGWGWLGMGIGWLLRIVLISLVIYWIVKLATKGRQPVENHDSARIAVILKERYAKGEIDEEEYIRRMEILKK